jgi:hypothetical protein
MPFFIESLVEIFKNAYFGHVKAYLNDRACFLYMKALP